MAGLVNKFAYTCKNMGMVCELNIDNSHFVAIRKDGVNVHSERIIIRRFPKGLGLNRKEMMA